jgi:hypothetical protein
MPVCDLGRLGRRRATCWAAAREAAELCAPDETGSWIQIEPDRARAASALADPIRFFIRDRKTALARWLARNVCRRQQQAGGGKGGRLIKGRTEDACRRFACQQIKYTPPPSPTCWPARVRAK